MDEETKTQILEDADHEAQRLHLIVENLLALARIEGGGQADTEPVLLKRVVDAVARNLRKLKPDRQLDVRLAPDLPPVQAVPVYLELVLRNLLDNADKYSPRDQPIEVEAGPFDHKNVQISVLDRGPGIKPEERQLVFERFYRSEHASRTYGAGMGLSVCRRLAERQGGRIWVEGREGGGSVFSFTLPVAEE